MAWHKRRHPDTNKAFGRESNLLATAINKLAATQYGLALQAFSASDLLQLFVPPELHDLLRDSFAEAAPHTSYDMYVACPVDAEKEARGDRMLLVFNWDHRLKGGFLPRTKSGAYKDYSAGHVYANCPSEIVERWQQVSHDMVEISYRFGMASYVFEQLNDIGKTAAAVRYHFPCVMALCDRAPGMKEVADSIREASTRSGDGLTIPSQVREFIRPANEHIARSLLLDDTENVPAPSGITYRVVGTSYHGKFSGWFNGS